MMQGSLSKEEVEQLATEELLQKYMSTRLAMLLERLFCKGQMHLRIADWRSAAAACIPTS